MANATATNSNGTCNITLPSDVHSMVLIPKTSGNARYINYCSWSDDSNAHSSQALGEWSANFSNISIVSNPDNLIDATTKHGTISQNTDPVITGMTKTSLTFTHRKNEGAPVEGDLLKVNVYDVTEDITVILILAEDQNDHNYLDFQMTVVVKSN